MCLELSFFFFFFYFKKIIIKMVLISLLFAIVRLIDGVCSFILIIYMLRWFYVGDCRKLHLHSTYYSSIQQHQEGKGFRIPFTMRMLWGR